MKVIITLNLTVDDDIDMENLTQCIVDLIIDDPEVDLPEILSVDDGQWALNPNQWEGETPWVHQPLGDGEGISVNVDASDDDRRHARAHRYWKANPRCETCGGSGILPTLIPTHAHDLRACTCVGLRYG